MKNKTFRVLIVDDKLPVLTSIKKRINTKISIAKNEFNIELLTLHVIVNESNGIKYISEKTLDLLNKYCRIPFDLMLLDYGYVKQGTSGMIELANLRIKYPLKSDEELINKIILSPSDIVKKA